MKVRVNADMTSVEVEIDGVTYTITEQDKRMRIDAPGSARQIYAREVGLTPRAAVWVNALTVGVPRS